MSDAGLKRPRLRRIAGSGWTWSAIALSVFAFNVVRSIATEIPAPPKVLLDLPEFTLTDQRGEPFGSKDLEGKIWIASFMFTSCPTLCPQITKAMQKVKHRTRGMGSGVHLVSFSVDPERDTPEVLAEYAARFGAVPARWTFLSGPLADVEAAVVKGFKQPIDRAPPDGAEPSFFDITHGTRLVLMDTKNRIRGFYETSDDEIDRLMNDTALLVAAELREPVAAR